MDAKLLQAMAADPREFRARLMIDCDGTSRPLGEVLEPWQAADFAALDPGWLRVAGRTDQPARLRAYLERPRGHSKTSDLAAMTAWALFASRHPQAGVAAAADRDQGRLLRDAVARLVSLNPWLRDYLDVQSYKVVNQHTGSTLEIIASDLGSSYGLTPSFLLLDEVSHWASSELLSSLISSAAKRPSCLVLCISNAGFGAGDSWQWQFREAARTDPDWYFSRLDGPKASWITERALSEQRRLLPPAAYNRLWLNQWQTSAGDALDPADIEAACVLDAPIIFDPHHEKYGAYVGGLDLGLKNDHAALVVLGLDIPSQRIGLAWCENWAPPKDGGQIDLQSVEAAVVDAHQRYHLAGVINDPWQAALMAQRLTDRGIVMVGMSFTPRNLDEMATRLVQAFRNRLLDLYREPSLMRDLSRLRVVERTQGFRLEAPRDEHGHADRATALALALTESMASMRSAWQSMNDPELPTLLSA